MTPTIQSYQTKFFQYFFVLGERVSYKDQISLLLDLPLRRDFERTLVVADPPRPIFGADFLHHYSLLTDVRKQKLVDSTISISTPAHESTAVVVSPLLFVAAPGNHFHALLPSFPELTDISFKHT